MASIFSFGDKFGGYDSPFGDWIAEDEKVRRERDAQRQTEMNRIGKSSMSKFKVVLMGGADFFNAGTYGSNKKLAEYLEKIASSKKYNIPLQKGDIQVVNSPVVGASSPDGKDIFYELLTIVKSNFDLVNGTLVLYGYSWGAHLLLSFLEFFREEKIKIALLISIDAAKGPESQTVSRRVTDNVGRNLNIFQTIKSPIGSRGGPNLGKNIKNVDLTGEKTQKVNPSCIPILMNTPSFTAHK